MELGWVTTVLSVSVLTGQPYCQGLHLQSVRVPTVCWLHLQPHCPLLSSLAASQPQPLLAMTQTHGIATPSLTGLQRFCACYSTTWSALHLAHSLPLLRSLFQKLSKTNYLLGVLLTSYNAVASFHIARTLLDMLAWLWLCESNSVLSIMFEEWKHKHNGCGVFF